MKKKLNRTLRLNVSELFLFHLTRDNTQKIQMITAPVDAQQCEIMTEEVVQNKFLPELQLVTVRPLKLSAGETF